MLPSPSARNLASLSALAICSVTDLEAAAAGEAVGAGGTAVGGAVGAAGAAQAVTINTVTSDKTPKKTRDFIFISSSKRLASIVSACIYIYARQ